MPYCTDCGGVVSQYASHCGHCGSPIEGALARPNTSDTSKGNVQNPAPEAKRTTGFWWWDLSHRDKFRRTLFLWPFVILLVVLWAAGVLQPPFGIPVPVAILGLLGLGIWQTIHEYSKWTERFVTQAAIYSDVCFRFQVRD